MSIETNEFLSQFKSEIRNLIREKISDLQRMRSVNIAEKERAQKYADNQSDSFVSFKQECLEEVYQYQDDIDKCVEAIAELQKLIE